MPAFSPKTSPTSLLPLATLHQFKTYLAIPDDETHDDQRLLWALKTASATLQQHTGRAFFPHHLTVDYDANPRTPHQIALQADLLALYNITDALGIITADMTYVDTAHRLTLRDGRAFVWDGDGVQALAVTGLWGWHDAYEYAWRMSDDALDVPLSASGTQITVTSVLAPDSMGASPRFQQGQLLRIGDDDATAEYIGIIALDSTNQTLHVMRGLHGTSARAHDAGIALYIYQPPYTIVHQCLRIATYLYRAPDALITDALPPEYSAPLARWRVLRI